MGLTLIDFFCGAGGSSQGASAIPGIEVKLAANHWERAIESHAANFPHAEHFRGDIHDADVTKLPAGDLFWASPECPQWSGARGERRQFDKQPDLFGETLTNDAADRSRALMWDVPRYLAAAQSRGHPVLAGVVENVVEVRRWARWDEWLNSIKSLSYSTRLVALNSMHARGAVTSAAPQSRDRLYLAYWLTSLGRSPDWDKWLRPPAWCASCKAWVRAVQWWKRPGADMGRYRQSYMYRCPNVDCRNAIVEPEVLPASVAIDWTDLGTKIGDRSRPLRDATRARIAAGLARYCKPTVLEVTWHDSGPNSRSHPVDEPLAAQTAQQTKGLACSPILVPTGGSWRDDSKPVSEPMATRTTSENDGIAILPEALLMRNNTPNGDPGQMVTPVTEPARTLTAAGHQSLLVPYYGNSLTAHPVTRPIGTLSTRDHYGLATENETVIDVDEVLFRMLKPAEIGLAMAFGADYVVIGTQRERIRQYGNAVTPPASEVLFSALVEAISPETELEAA